MEHTLLALSIASLGLLALMHYSFTSAFIDQQCFISSLRGSDPLLFARTDYTHIHLTDAVSDTVSDTVSEYTSRVSSGVASEAVMTTTPSYIFSPQKGYLILPPKSRKKYNISSATYYLPSDTIEKCFHLHPYMELLPLPLRSLVPLPLSLPLRSLVPLQLLKYTFGYDTIVLNLMKKLSHDRGFLYMEHRRKMVDMSLFSRFVFSVATMNSFGNPILWDNVNFSHSNSYSNNENESGGDLHSNENDDDGGGCTCTVDEELLIGNHNCNTCSSHVHGSGSGPLQVHRLRDQIAAKLCIVVTSTFLFFAMTSMVSFILKQTQSRMLKFTFLLQYHVRNQIPYTSLVFIHVFESLIFVPIMLGRCGMK